MAVQTVEQTTRLAPFQEQFLTDIFTSTSNLFKPTILGGQGLTMPFADQIVAGLSPEQYRALKSGAEGIGGFQQYMDEGLEDIRLGQTTTGAGIGQTLLGAETQAGALETLGRAVEPEGGIGALADARSQVSGLDFQNVAESRDALGDTVGGIRSAVADAQEGLRDTTGQFDPADISRFQSPFEDQVVEQVLRDLAKQGEQQVSRLDQEAARLGALSNARLGVERGRIGENVLEAQAREAGRLRQQGFQQAQQAALQSFESAQRRAQQAETTAGQLGVQGGAQEAQIRATQGQLGLGLGELDLSRARAGGALGAQEAQLLGALAGQEAQIGQDQGRTGATIGALGAQQAQLGQGIASLGFQGQQAAVQDINTLLGLGGLQQQQRQQELDVARQNELARQQIPFQQIGFQSDIFRGVPALQQQATTTTTPTASGFDRYGLPLAIAGIGAAGQAGGFGNLFGRP